MCHVCGMLVMEIGADVKKKRKEISTNIVKNKHTVKKKESMDYILLN